jgi:hypothetical protein
MSHLAAAGKLKATGFQMQGRRGKFYLTAELAALIALARCSAFRRAGKAFELSGIEESDEMQEQSATLRAHSTIY